MRSRVSDERRLFRAATFVCAWPPLEEVENFYRLEEPLELVAALLMNVPLAIKYGEARSGRGERI